MENTDQDSANLDKTHQDKVNLDKNNPGKNHHCPECQYVNAESALFCDSCGASLGNSGVTMTYDFDAELTQTFHSSEQADTLNNSVKHTEAQQITDGIAKFKIKDILGQGGMGAVYLAEDKTLHRDVALKVFRANQSVKGSEQQNLLEEARLACKINHPNIVTIYDVARTQFNDGNNNTDADTHFIVMERVDGKPMNDLIPASGFPLDKALNYACQIADGLVCAHKHGIVHRDIKPHNLMLNQDDKIKILDFGIAQFKQAQSVKHENSNPRIIESKSIVGTPPYMAPEQTLCATDSANGKNDDEPGIDHRSDIFGFGVVLYEFLTGYRPFVGKTLQAFRQSLTADEYKPIKTVIPELPNELALLVDKMLAIDPDQRWQTTLELRYELYRLHAQLTARKNWWQRQHWLAKSAIVIPFIALFTWSINAVIFPPTTEELVARQVSEAKKIALLPFDNISGDPLLQIFVDGLGVGLNSDLTTAGYEQGDGHTWVIPASEVNKMKDVTAQSLYTKFGVDLAVSGSVQHYGSTRNVVLNLINASDGRQIKTTEIAIDADRLFEGQNAVREQVFALLNWQVSNELAQQFSERHTQFDGAYKHYIEGRAYLYRLDIKGNLDKALASFQAAIVIDPSFEQAYVGLAETQLRKYKDSSDVVWLEKMIGTIDELSILSPLNLKLDYLSAELLFQKGEYQQAILKYKNSLIANRDNLETIVGLAKAHNEQGNIKQAEVSWKTARDLAPNNWRLLASIGKFYFQNGMYKQALMEFERLTKISPNNEYGFNNIAGIYYTMGEIEEAIKYTHKAISLTPTASAYSNLGTMYFYIRQYRNAQLAYEKALEINDSNYMIWGNLGDSLKLQNHERTEYAFSKATNLAIEAISVNPDNTNAIASVAYYFANLENETKSREFAEKVGVKNSGLEHFFVAMAYDQLNLLDNSFEHLKIAITKNYPIEEILESPLLENCRAAGFIDKLNNQIK